MEVQQLAFGEPPEELLVLEGELDRQDLLGRAAGGQVPVAVGLRAVVLEPAGRQAQRPLEPTDQPGQARQPGPLLEQFQRPGQAAMRQGDRDLAGPRERAPAQLQPVADRLVREVLEPGADAGVEVGWVGGRLLGVVHRPEHRMAQDHLGDPAPAVEQLQDLGQPRRIGDARYLPARAGAEGPGITERAAQLAERPGQSRLVEQPADRPDRGPIAEAEHVQQVQRRPERRARSVRDQQPFEELADLGRESEGPPGVGPVEELDGLAVLRPAQSPERPAIRRRDLEVNRGAAMTHDAAPLTTIRSGATCSNRPAACSGSVRQTMPTPPRDPTPPIPGSITPVYRFPHRAHSPRER